MILEVTVLAECCNCGDEEEITYTGLPLDTAIRKDFERDFDWRVTLNHQAGEQWLRPDCWTDDPEEDEIA